MKLDVEKLIVYFITDSRFGKHEDLVEGALKGGVRAVQFREKKMNDREMYFTARKIRRITEDYDALFFVNDRVDIAMAVNADGVHVGQSDLPAYAIREFFEGYIGVSAHTIDEAKRVEKFADYLGVGPVFVTGTKEDAKEPIGIEGLKKIVDSVNVPVVAIGGIDTKNAGIVFESGVAGVAVVSAIAGADDVAVAARKFAEIARQYKK